MNRFLSLILALVFGVAACRAASLQDKLAAEYDYVFEMVSSEAHEYCVPNDIRVAQWKMDPAKVPGGRILIGANRTSSGLMGKYVVQGMIFDTEREVRLDGHYRARGGERFDVQDLLGGQSGKRHKAILLRGIGRLGARNETQVAPSPFLSERDKSLVRVESKAEFRRRADNTGIELAGTITLTNNSRRNLTDTNVEITVSGQNGIELGKLSVSLGGAMHSMGVYTAGFSKDVIWRSEKGLAFTVKLGSCLAEPAYEEE